MVPTMETVCVTLMCNCELILNWDWFVRAGLVIDVDEDDEEDDEDDDEDVDDDDADEDEDDDDGGVVDGGDNSRSVDSSSCDLVASNVALKRSHAVDEDDAEAAAQDAKR